MSQSQEIVFGSLGYLAQNNNQSIAESFLNVDAILIVDISASMLERDCQYGHTRYAVAVKELERLQRSQPGKVAVIEFACTALFSPGGIPSQPSGTTNLTGALQYIKPADGCGIKIILISDGDPDNEITAIDCARTFATKIDTVYIGPEGGHGADFLRRLSAATGGLNVTQDVRAIAHLSDTVTKLLTA